MNLLEDLNADKPSNDPSVSLSSNDVVPPVKQKSNDDSLKQLQNQIRGI